MHRYRFILSLAVGIGLLLTLSSAGLAASGHKGSGGSSSLSLVVLGSDGEARAAAIEPSQGGQVTFDVATTQTDRPFVNLRCYQNGAFVYDAWHGFFDSYAQEPNFTLASGYWTGGAADCTARLVDWGRNGRDRTLTTLDFQVKG